MGLPFDLRDKLISPFLSIKAARVEHDRYLRELDREEFNQIVSAIVPTDDDLSTDIENRHQSYMADVECVLDYNIMLTNQQLYAEGCNLLQNRNKFVQIEGWTDADFKALSKLGRVPIWSYRPIWHGETLVAQGLPCKVDPVLRFINTLRAGDTIFIYIKDLPLVCKAIRQCRSYPNPSAPTEFLLEFNIPEEGLTPAFWDLKTNSEVQDFLNEGLIRYTGLFILYLLWRNQDPALGAAIEGNNEATGNHADEEPTNDGLSQVFPRPVNELEIWIANHVRPWRPAERGPKFRYMIDSIKSKFIEAEELSSSNYFKAVGLYLEVKDLVRQLFLEEPQWYYMATKEHKLELCKTYSTCCYRLSFMSNITETFVESNQSTSRLAVLQWAYINCVEALSMIQDECLGAKPATRSELFITLGNLQLQFDNFCDSHVATSLCLAIYGILKARMPALGHDDLIEMTNEQFAGSEGIPAPAAWEAFYTPFQGQLFPVSWLPLGPRLLGQNQPDLTREQWKSKIEQTSSLLDLQFPRSKAGEGSEAVTHD